MIMRLIWLRNNWLKFSIWNEVVWNQLNKIKHRFSLDVCQIFSEFMMGFLGEYLRVFLAIGSVFRGSYCGFLRNRQIFLKDFVGFSSGFICFVYVLFWIFKGLFQSLFLTFGYFFLGILWCSFGSFALCFWDI